MTSDKFEKTLKKLKKATDRFSEALQEPVSAIVMDATIQRFEFTYELMWKTLKIYLEDFHGIQAGSPRLVFKEAYALDIIENEDIFLEMLKSRNLLSHTVNEEQAAVVFKKCPNFLKAVEDIFNNMTDEVINSGVPIEVRKGNKRLRILPVKGKNKLDNLRPRENVISGDPDNLPNIHWDEEIQSDLP